jgi:hypothetical protein
MRKRTLTDLASSQPSGIIDVDEAQKPKATKPDLSLGGEVLLFQTPSDDSTLFVTRLHKDTTQLELYEAFSPFGLIHDVTIYQSTSEEKPFNYAFVKYYSCWAAYRAQQQLNQHKFHDLPCKVNFSRKKKNSQYDRPFPLTIQRCLEMSNHYLGFDGWSSSIVALAESEALTLDRSTGLYKCAYKCIVRFTFKRDTRTLDAIGFGTHEGDKRGTVIEFAKKKAVTEAYKNAFASLALILLKNGKVAIHLLDTSIDQWDPSAPSGDDHQKIENN